METQRQNIQQLFLQSCNLSKNCIAMLDEKLHARVDVNDAKVCSDLLSTYVHTTLNVIGSFDVKKRTLAEPFIELIFFKIYFFGFCTKKWTQ